MRFEVCVPPYSRVLWFKLPSHEEKYLKCIVQSNNNALGQLRVFVTMECELLGAIPTGFNVRRYCFAGTIVFDVSHVGNRKKLEKSTRGYSGRCSYASPESRTF